MGNHVNIVSQKSFVRGSHWDSPVREWDKTFLDSNGLQTKPIHATFVMEQHLGHATFYQNLRRSLQMESRLAANWVEITYFDRSGWGWMSKYLPPQLYSILLGRQQVASGLRRQANDILFFNTQVPATLSGQLLRRQPYILCTDITPRQYDRMAATYGHRTDHPWWLKQYKHWVNVDLFRQAKRIVAWSHWVQHSLVEEYGVAPERVAVIPPGVDIERWQPLPRTEPARPLRILFVGGDFYRKGGDILLQAFRALPPGQAELVIVTRSVIEGGDGITIRRDLQPNSPELIALYQTSDLFVLPTKAEAFGIAAVEAIAVGLPVIAADVGGVSDIVIDNQTGLLMPTADAANLQTRLLSLLENPERRTQMAYSARKHAEAHFDAQKNATHIFDLIGAIHKSASQIRGSNLAEQGQILAS